MLSVIDPIARGADHQLRVVDTGNGIVLRVYRHVAGAWVPSKNFTLALRYDELPRLIEGLTLAAGHRCGPRAHRP